MSEAETPGQVFARRVREARERQGLTQQQIVDRLAELGLPMDRSTFVKLEKGERAATAPLDKVFAIAVALGVAPVHLIVPRDDDAEVAVAPKLTLPAAQARRWIRGFKILEGSDIGAYLAELPPGEQRRLVELALLEQDKAAAYRAGARQADADFARQKEEEDDG